MLLSNTSAINVEVMRNSQQCKSVVHGQCLIIAYSCGTIPALIASSLIYVIFHLSSV